MKAIATLTQPATDEEDEYTFLEPIKNARTAILCRHNPCGSVFMITPNHLKCRGHLCEACTLFERNHHIKPTVKNGIMMVRCSKKHRFEILKKDFYKKVAGEIKCPICEKLKYLDPAFKDAQVQFVFNFSGGHLIG